MRAKRRRAVLWFGVALAVIVLLAAAPVISVFLAVGISNVLGCGPGDNGGACRLMGIDISNTLSAMSIFGWLAIDTLPLGVLAFLIWLVVAAVTAIVSWRRRRIAAQALIRRGA
jgi:ABC-type Fe3+ transport system permease subunit